MKKIISLFQRNYDGDRLVRDEVVPGAEWVVAGEGVATRKYDGTCCMIRDGKLFKRYEVKKGKSAPIGFESAQEADPITGHWPGWVPVGEGPEDQYHREGLKQRRINPIDLSEIPLNCLPNGTYELLGPKIQGNPEKLENHFLADHEGAEVLEAPRSFNELKEWFKDKDIEGIVWHHTDGRMVKIKKKDFGLKR